MRFGIIVFDGFDELDAIGPYEALCNAKRQGAPFEVSLVAEGAPTWITAAHGTKLAPQASLAEPFDVLIAAGGGWANHAPQGVRRELERGALSRVLAERHAAGTVVGSVCTGALLLAQAGLLRGRPATTHPVAQETLAASGALLVDARVVDDGDVVTAGGVTSGIDLGLWLIERFAGAELAQRTSAALVHPRIGTVHFGPRAAALSPEVR